MDGFLPGRPMSEICRFCLMPAKEMEQIFEDGGLFLEKINDIVKLQMYRGDGFPAQICQQCSNQLTSSCNFMDRCLETDSKLRAYASQSQLMNQLLCGQSVQEVCRLCLVGGGGMQPIFGRDDACLKTIIDILQLAASGGDGLPAQVCQECAHSLDSVWSFKERCVASNDKLKEYIRKVFEELNGKRANKVAGYESDDGDSDVSSSAYGDSSGDEQTLKRENFPNFDDDSSQSSSSMGSDNVKLVINEVDDTEVNESEVDVNVKSLAVNQSKTKVAPLVAAPVLNNIVTRSNPLIPNKSKTLLFEVSDQQEAADSTDGDSDAGSPVLKIKGLGGDSGLKIGRMVSTRSKGIRRSPRGIKSEREEVEEEKESECSSPAPSDDGKLIFQEVNIEVEERGLLVAVESLKTQAEPDDEDGGNGTLFACHLCKKQFPLKSSLENHVQQNKRIYRCCACARTYGRGGHYERHVSYHMSRGKACKCKICGESFPVMTLLSKHLKTHSRSKAYKCHVCSNQYSSNTYLQVHIRSHSQLPRPYKCTLCPKSFLQVSGLRQHQKFHQVRKFTCRICDSKYFTKKCLELHVKRHDDEMRPFECDICQVSFKQKPHLDRHKLTHKPGERVHCPKCDKSLRDQNTLAKHLLLHEAKGSEKKYECEECKKSFHFKEYLVKHIAVQHSDVPLKRTFQCPDCEKSFFTQPMLRSHIKTHNPEKRFKCEVCGKAFAAKGYLVTHMQSHSELRQYACTQCDKDFKNSNGLKYHQLSHTGEKPHKCPHCERTYTSSHALKTHIRGHTGDILLYSCKHCDKKFRTSGSVNTHIKEKHTPGLVREREICSICSVTLKNKSVLKKHMILHTKEKPFACCECNMSFPFKLYLERHVQSVHEGSKREDSRSTAVAGISKSSDYECTMCKESFPFKLHLSQHIKTCHDGKVVKPDRPTVSKTTNPAQSAKSQHVDTTRESKLPISKTVSKPTKLPQSPKFSCKLCQELFVSKIDLAQHGKTCRKAKTVRLHEATEVAKPPQSGEFKCRLCTESFPFKLYLLQHINLHHNDSQVVKASEKSLAGRKRKIVDFQCTVCKETYPSKSFLSEHLKSHHKEREISEGTENGIVGETSAKIAKKQITDFECHVCHESFPFKAFLAAHLKGHNKENAKGAGNRFEHDANKKKTSEFQCHICHESFPFKMILAEHIESHNEGKSTQMKTVTKASQKQCVDFQCHVCLKSFLYKALLTKHLKSHTKENNGDVAQNVKKETQITMPRLPFECHICMKTFSFNTFLRKHLLTHKKESADRKEKPKISRTNNKFSDFVCHVCNESFPFRKFLAEHLKTHGKDNKKRKETGNTKNSGSQGIVRKQLNDFVCPLCKESFPFRKFLTKHLKSHKNKNTKSKENTSKSVAKVPKEKPVDYECHICKQSFPFKFYLSEHLKVHSEESSKNNEVIRKESPTLKVNVVKRKSEVIPKERPTLKVNVAKRKSEVIPKKRPVMKVNAKKKSDDLECNICKETFPFKTYLSEHVKLHHPENIENKAKKLKSILKISKRKLDDFECHICKESFPFKTFLFEHLKLHLNDNTKGKKTSLQQVIKLPKSKFDNFPCLICKESFPFKMYLLEHIELHHKDATAFKDDASSPKITARVSRKPMAAFKCPKCKQSFRYKAYLSEHLKLHTKGKVKMIASPKSSKVKKVQQRDYECHICKEWFPVKLFLLKHLDSHGKGRASPLETDEPLDNDTVRKVTETQLAEFECPVCKEPFPYKSYLSEHIRSQHKRTSMDTKVEAKPKVTKVTKAQLAEFECKICKESFPYKVFLSKHIKTQHKSKSSSHQSTLKPATKIKQEPHQSTLKTPTKVKQEPHQSTLKPATKIKQEPHQSTLKPATKVKQEPIK